MPGQPDSVRPTETASNNIVRAFEVNRAHVKNPATSPTERGIALAWLFHLVGDAHQPLHASSYYTTEYPKGGTQVVRGFFGIKI